jgi:predicted permease
MPPEFLFPTRSSDYWIPIRFAEADFSDRDNNYLRVVARLKSGVSLARAKTEMSRIASLLERTYPKENAHTGVSVIRLRDEVPWRTRYLLTALLGAAAGLLLIACTNLASLLLARAVSRRKELAVRTALGAGRERLLRQLLTESLVLAAVGGAVGVLLAIAAVPLGARLVPTGLPIAETPSPDLRVLAFAALLTAITGVAFGVLPALRATGGADASALRDGDRAGSTRSTERLRAILVVTEVAVSVALLVVAGLLIRALGRLERVDPGFRSQNVLTLETTLPRPRYDVTERRAQFYERVLEDVRRLPGVSSAAYVSFLPMVMRGGIWPVTLDERPVEPGTEPFASLRFATPGFFETLRVPLRRGRDFATSDRRGTPSAAVVSESFARFAWPGQDPIGKRFRFALQQPTVVGVVGDVRVRGLESESEPQVYLSYRQVDDGSVIWYAPKNLVLRSSVSPEALLPEIRRIVANADPQVPVSNVQTLSSIVEAETAPRRVQLDVLGAFAIAALFLAGVGIHGLLAFTVSQRSREIGIRIALGAQRREILRMVVRQGVRLAGLGALAGIAVAYAAGRGMEALLFGVHPGDAATFLLAVAVCLLTALAGSLLPARRAVRLDPLSVIRAE